MNSCKLEFLGRAYGAIRMQTQTKLWLRSLRSLGEYPSLEHLILDVRTYEGDSLGFAAWSAVAKLGSWVWVFSLSHD